MFVAPVTILKFFFINSFCCCKVAVLVLGTYLEPNTPDNSLFSKACKSSSRVAYCWNVLNCVVAF